MAKLRRTAPYLGCQAVRKAGHLLVRRRPVLGHKQREALPAGRPLTC